MDSNLRYAIATTLLKGVGEITAKKLISYAGGYEQVFNLSVSKLEKIEGLGKLKAQKIYHQLTDKAIFNRVDEELSFIEKNKITPLLYHDKSYPEKLKHCEDAPLVLYTKGKMDYQEKKILSVVGTRKISDYGKVMIDKILKGFEGLDVLVVSGLAYGVDSYAHKVCVQNQIQTIGVLAHGLDRIYPATNRKLAQSMLENGGVMTEFMSETNPDRENFPKRNRIIAGMADATLVIESARKGGSLITAEIANSYSRDVFAVPGRIGDETSEGCNYLIKNNKAHLVETADDIIQLMGWEVKKEKKKPIQQAIFADVTPEEKSLLDLLGGQTPKHIDQLVAELNSTNSKLAMLLLELEFKGLVKSLPGKMYGVV